MSIVAGLAAVSILGGGGEATADAQGLQPQDLTGLTLEQLADIEITSVSRRPEQLSSAAAAVYVITREDIRRSGAASLPEVLRLAPNLQVQRVGSVDYAITARGFNSFETANKLLVLIDGRSIYTTLFSGVLWDAQGLVLEDIERIEVISGPGGALYDANAVNGVINITTRSARETRGPAFAVGAARRRLGRGPPLGREHPDQPAGRGDPRAGEAPHHPGQPVRSGPDLAPRRPCPDAGGEGGGQQLHRRGGAAERQAGV